MQQPLWKPDETAARASGMARLIARLRLNGGSLEEEARRLHAYSIEHTEAFWNAVWDFCGIIGDKGAPPHAVDLDHMPGARFFPEAQLNFAENLLVKDGNDVAIIFWREDRQRRVMSWAELRATVSRLQQVFVAWGVKPGDRIVAMLPNIPEAVAAMLAGASLGAIWSSCSPDFGVQGVLDRFGQIEPKIFISCDGYLYGGKTFPLGDKLETALDKLPSVERCVIVPFIGDAEPVAKRLRGAVTWPAALAEHKPREPIFTRLPFAHPLYVLFSSGTTGVPKCIVQSAGGTLLQHVKEHRLHCDLKEGERLSYFTTLGWMMWNWLASGLASRTTLMLYDGSPFHPDGNILFDYAQIERINFFGTSAKYIDAVKKADLRPRDTHDLAHLRVLASTGSPLAPESFDFVYDAIKSDVHLASISGGTDIVSCFVLGNPLLPVWRGEIQGPGLGMATDVFDENGRHLARGKGELVCTCPFPSMPVGFWNDPDGVKYRAAYFERFPNVWHHGDFAEWTEHGGIIIHGRSDATLNPSGVRIGTAEIYRQVEQLSEVRESLAIAQDWDGDVRVVLFVVLADNVALDKTLSEKIKRRIREGASPRHVPAKIVAVSDIPRTKSGKITELAVRDVVHGREVKNKEALANPQALELYRNIPELAT